MKLNFKQFIESAETDNITALCQHLLKNGFTLPKNKDTFNIIISELEQLGNELKANLIQLIINHPQSQLLLDTIVESGSKGFIGLPSYFRRIHPHYDRTTLGFNLDNKPYIEFLIPAREFPELFYDIKSLDNDKSFINIKLYIKQSTINEAISMHMGIQQLLNEQTSSEILKNVELNPKPTNIINIRTFYNPPQNTSYYHYSYSTPSDYRIDDTSLPPKILNKYRRQIAQELPSKLNAKDAHINAFQLSENKLINFIVNDIESLHNLKNISHWFPHYDGANY